MRKPSATVARSRSQLIANALLFQCAWWIILLLQGAAAWLFTSLLLLLHFVFISQHKSTEALFIMLLAAIGIVVDTLWFSFGLMLYAGNNQLPLWLIPMWIAFATTVVHSLHWLARTPYLAALLGALFGPLSYSAGATLTDVTISQPIIVWLFFLGGFWAALLPLGFSLWRYLIRCEQCEV